MKDIFRLQISSFDVLLYSISNFYISIDAIKKIYFQNKLLINLQTRLSARFYFYRIKPWFLTIASVYFISSPLIFHTVTNNREFHLDLPFKRRKRIVLFCAYEREATSGLSSDDESVCLSAATEVVRKFDR